MPKTSASSAKNKRKAVGGGPPTKKAQKFHVVVQDKEEQERAAAVTKEVVDSDNNDDGDDESSEWVRNSGSSSAEETSALENQPEPSNLNDELADLEPDAGWHTLGGQPPDPQRDGGSTSDDDDDDDDDEQVSASDEDVSKTLGESDDTEAAASTDSGVRGLAPEGVRGLASVRECLGGWPRDLAELLGNGYFRPFSEFGALENVFRPVIVAAAEAGIWLLVAAPPREPGAARSSLLPTTPMPCAATGTA